MATIKLRSVQKFILPILVACLCLFPATPSLLNEPITQELGNVYWSSFTSGYHFVSIRPHVPIKFFYHKLLYTRLPDIYRDIPDTSRAMPVMFLCIIQILLILLLLMPLKFGSCRFVVDSLDGTGNIPERGNGQDERQRTSEQNDRPNGQRFEGFPRVFRAGSRRTGCSQILYRNVIGNPPQICGEDFDRFYR